MDHVTEDYKSLYGTVALLHDLEIFDFINIPSIVSDDDNSVLTGIYEP